MTVSRLPHLWTPPVAVGRFLCPSAALCAPLSSLRMPDPAGSARASGPSWSPYTTSSTRLHGVHRPDIAICEIDSSIRHENIRDQITHLRAWTHTADLHGTGRRPASAVLPARSQCRRPEWH